MNLSRAQHARSRATSGDDSGIVLLEVVVALAAFFTLGGIIVGSMNSAANAATRIRQDARAADLAVTIMSQIHAGMVEPTDAGPEYCDEPLDDWTWQIVTEPVSDSPDAGEMTSVEVIVRDTRSGRAHRLMELVTAEARRLGGEGR
ncbi:MAG: hypothetical protein ACLFVW_02945 [Phycisphaerae bacterium]